jgi:hypothetical protein
MNKGTGTETFNVSTYYGNSPIGTILVGYLDPDEQATLTFAWNTSLVNAGYYQISASAPLPNDANVLDNIFQDGFVEVKRKPQLTHDVAVENVIPSSISVYVGDIVEIQVVVGNLGAYSESFSVTAFYNSSPIGVFPLEEVDARVRMTIFFRLATQGLALGNYTLGAAVSQVPGEEYLDNNRFVDGVLEVKAVPSTVHDVAVVNAVPAARLVYVGDVVDVNVTVKNKGLENESFNVFVYYSGNPIGPALRVYNLAPDAEYTLTFQWNTYRVLLGNYTIAGYAEPVLGEVNTGDNMYFDGEVRVVRSPGGFFIMDWFGWLLLILLLLLLLLLLWLLLRKRRKKEEETFYAGWTAWYYGYDLRPKSSAV